MRGSGETIAALAGRVLERGDPGAEAFRALVDLYYAARFGGRIVDMAHMDALARRVVRPEEDDARDASDAA